MTKQVYFKGLDGLRFLAAFAVILHHAEILKLDYGVSNAYLYRYFLELGPIAVTFFFVLSGFLITNILITEKQRSNNINFTNFFIKRVLRIFPLFYIITFLSFVIFPNIPFFDQPHFSLKLYHDFATKIFLYITMQPHLVFVLYPKEPIPYGVVAWSIGVEEHFYLLWPLLIKYFQSFFKLSLLVFIFFASAPFLINHSYFHFTSKNIIINANNFFDTLRFSCMSIGGIVAFLYLNKSLIIKYLTNKYVEYLVILITLFVFIYGYPYKYLKHELYSLLFIIVIYNVATNEKSLINIRFGSILESKIFKFLGVRSYGIYMYHMIAIQIAIKATFYLFGFQKFNFIANLYFYVLTLILTIIISVLSFSFIEKPILNLKKYIK